MATSPTRSRGSSRTARVSAPDSRAAVRAAIEERYTAPADQPSGIVDEAPRA